VVVPANPGTNFVLVETHIPFGHLERLFDAVAAAPHTDKLPKEALKIKGSTPVLII